MNKILGYTDLNTLKESFSEQGSILYVKGLEPTDPFENLEDRIESFSSDIYAIDSDLNDLGEKDIKSEEQAYALGYRCKCRFSDIVEGGYDKKVWLWIHEYTGNQILLYDLGNGLASFIRFI